MNFGGLMGIGCGDISAICRICRLGDKNKNMITSTITDQEVTWTGSAHLSCIKKYNKIHKHKYSICEYDETGKFLGEVTPI